MMLDTITGSDMFCGCGGSTTGAVFAGIRMRIAGNHWDRAIESHNTNYPDIDHHLADLSNVHPSYWPTTSFLWASPECPYHSQAGGRKRPPAQQSFFGEDADDPAAVRSRATMWDVVRFADFHEYDMIVVENVVHVRKWRLWSDWLRTMGNLGYNHKACYLNSMFFGVPQSRDRIYVVFWKKGIRAPDLEFRPPAPCATCGKDVDAVQSWKPGRSWGWYGDHGQYVYRCPHCTDIVHPYVMPALIAIDWTDLGERIGDRKHPLKPRTMARITAGLEKFGDRFLILNMAYAITKGRHGMSTDTDPLPTMTGTLNHALISPFLASVNYFADRPREVSREPLPTQTTGNKSAICFPGSSVIVLRRNADAQSLDDPLSTVTAGGINHGLLMPQGMLIVNRANGSAKPIDGPTPTLLASGSSVGLLRIPLPFLSKYYGTGGETPINEPMGCLTTIDRHALINPPPRPSMEDCTFRMLKPEEIKLGMSFPPEYVILGTKREQIRQSGNAVTPPVAAGLCQRVIAVLS